MYTWSYIVLTGAIFYALLSLAFLAAGRSERGEADRRVWQVGSTIVSGLFLALIAANLPPPSLRTASARSKPAASSITACCTTAT